jgi:uncharacterized protein
MIVPENIPDSREIVSHTYFIFGAIIVFWILAWILKIQMDKVAVITELGSFIYWTAAKLLLWILPSVWLIRLSRRDLKQVWNLSNFKQWLRWGLEIGLALAMIGGLKNYLRGSPVFPTRLDYGLVNALLISPLFEEFLVRGGIMGNLQKSYAFIKSNLISSLLFVILHIPGWFFMGNLRSMLFGLNGAASIFIVGLLCGIAVKRSGSVLGGMIVHFLNNLV